MQSDKVTAKLNNISLVRSVGTLSHGIKVEGIGLLKFLLPVLSSFLPVKEEDDEQTQATGTDQGQTCQSDASTGCDEQLGIPLVLILRWVGNDVQLRIGNDLHSGDKQR